MILFIILKLIASYSLIRARFSANMHDFCFSITIHSLAQTRKGFSSE